MPFARPESTAQPPLAQNDDGLCGLLPLSEIPESGCYGYFPGETFHHRGEKCMGFTLVFKQGIFLAMP